MAGVEHVNMSLAEGDISIRTYNKLFLYQYLSKICDWISNSQTDLAVKLPNEMMINVLNEIPDPNWQDPHFSDERGEEIGKTN